MKRLLVFVFVSLPTAVVGNHIHHSVFWSVMDFMFWPFAWLKWLILQQVNIHIIRDSFAFFWS
jgi:hypothetical protein